jgi:hypothetical protein
MKEPFSGDELLHYRFTRRKKEPVDFDASESGMAVYFSPVRRTKKASLGHGARWYRPLPTFRAAYCFFHLSRRHGKRFSPVRKAGLFLR